jgi:hypothetical protein
MIGYRTLVSFALAAGTLVVAPARADDCPQLRMVASATMAYDDGGRPYIPVTLASTQKYMLVDSGGALSEIGQKTVDELHLPVVNTMVEQYGVNGQHSHKAAEVTPFKIGNLVADHMQLMIDPDGDAYGGDMAGVIGPALLRYYDADFDFGANKFNLMMQDHCAGKVIYWPAAAVAVIPMRVAKKVGHIIVPVTLDGVKLNALIDTGSTNTFLNSMVAESDFKLKLNSPDAPDVGSVGGSANQRIYRHTFHSLDLEGIAVGNLKVDIFADVNRGVLSSPPKLGSRLSDTDEAASLEDITIGMDVLKHLHLYIAYKEQVLYVTPAQPAPASAVSQPAPATAASQPAPSPH